MSKKFISAILCAALLASIAPAAALNASADGTSSDYGLAEKTSDGVILHAFDWSYNTIKEKLPAIAEAGYTSVQTSPVQAPKDFNASQDTGGQWWKLYQPLNFSVATENTWLGTKSELKDLCKEADKYGIKIICDIVSNHMGKGKGSSGQDLIAEDIKNYESDIYSNVDSTFHQYNKLVNGDTNVQNIVQGTLDGLPDLNTGNEIVQERVIALLEECIDCGVDGFRFDAAKHIETPDDGEYSSDFWPNVITTATKYAESKGVDLYCYGEILNTPGTGRDIKSYTQYIDVTDNKASDKTLVAVINNNAEGVVSAQSYTYKSDSPVNYVLWAESHDTYMGESGSAGIVNTSKVSNENIAKAWAIIASRSDSKSLYLARPGDLMGDVGDNAWESAAVSEINKFHNKYIGISDEVYNDGDVVAVQRGDNGIVLVNLGSSSDINVTTKGMIDGSYIDAITGNTFNVKNGKISGTVGSSGIAVVYEGAATTPRANVSVADNTSFKTDTLSVTLTLENAVSGTYSINGASPVTFKGSTTIKVGSGIKSGDITIKVTATDGKKTTETTRTYTKEEGNNSGVFVYLDKDSNSTTKKWTKVYVYAFYEEVKGTPTATNGSWPGVPMDYDEETGLYYYELPKDLPVGKAKVIFNNGSGGMVGKDQTGDLSLTSKSMIYKDNSFYDPNGTELIYGDVDGSGKIDSADALSILRASVSLETYTAAQTAQADVDGDNSITSSDALLVLRGSVGLTDSNSKAGQTFVFSGNVDSDNKQTDSKPADNKSGSVFYVVNRAGWIFNDGCPVKIENKDTKEVLNTTKSADNDSAAYSYVTLPDSWKNIAVYRVKDLDTPISEAYNSWDCGTIKEGTNSVYLTSDKGYRFENYTPQS